MQTGKYYVKYWDNGTDNDGKDYKAGDIHSTHTDPKRAKTACRKLGHTGENNPGFTSYPPIAYVSMDEGWGEGCWYNPRFRKETE